MQREVSRPESPPTHAILTKEKVLTKPPNAPSRPRRPDDYFSGQYPHHLSLAWARLQEHGEDNDDGDVDDELVALSHISPPTRTSLLPRRKLFQDSHESSFNNNPNDDDTRDPVVSPLTNYIPPQLPFSHESRERPPTRQLPRS